MEIITKIDTNSLLDILKNPNNNKNILNFVEDINKDYYIFEKIIDFLINIGYDLTDLIEMINIKEIFIVDNETELKNISYTYYWKFKDNIILVIE